MLVHIDPATGKAIIVKKNLEKGCSSLISHCKAVGAMFEIYGMWCLYVFAALVMFIEVLTFTLRGRRCSQGDRSFHSRLCTTAPHHMFLVFFYVFELTICSCVLYVFELTICSYFFNFFHLTICSCFLMFLNSPYGPVFLFMFLNLPYFPVGNVFQHFLRRAFTNAWLWEPGVYSIYNAGDLFRHILAI